MRDVVLLLALLVAFAAGTWAVGWWAVPLIALAYGLWRGRAAPRAPGPAFVGLAAGLAWGALLAAAAAAAPVGALAGRLAALMGMSAPALYAATVLLPGLLAWSAAALGDAALGDAARGGRAAGASADARSAKVGSTHGGSAAVRPD